MKRFTKKKLDSKLETRHLDKGDYKPAITAPPLWILPLVKRDKPAPTYYKCADCGHLAAYNAYNVRRGALKEHCVKCGSTFLVPASKLATWIDKRSGRTPHAI